MLARSQAADEGPPVSTQHHIASANLAGAHQDCNLNFNPQTSTIRPPGGSGVFFQRPAACRTQITACVQPASKREIDPFDVKNRADPNDDLSNDYDPPVCHGTA